MKKPCLNIVGKGEDAGCHNFSFSHQVKPFPKRQILDSSKLKELADDNFEFNENNRKFSKQVENTVGKGEIAHYEQFLFSHSVFQRFVLQAGKNQSLLGKGLRKRHQLGRI